MNKPLSIKKLAAFGLILVALRTSVLADVNDTGNMLQDPGFETTPMPGTPSYWYLWVPDSEKTKAATYERVAGAGVAGSYAAQLSADFVTRASVGGKRFRVKPNERFKVSFFYRVLPDSSAASGQPGVILRMSLFDVSGAKRMDPLFLGVSGKVSPRADSSMTFGMLSETWKQVSGEITIPAEAGLADIGLFIWGFRGVAQFDNVSVTLID